MADRSPSRRERQVSRLLAAGKSVQQAADELGIGFATAESHRYRATRRRGQLPGLSRRQREVVSCLALGLTVEEVANHLGIARGTAVNHRALASLTIGARSAVALTHYAILQGWIQAGDALSPERVEVAIRRIATQSGGS